MQQETQAVEGESLNSETISPCSPWTYLAEEILISAQFRTTFFVAVLTWEQQMSMYVHSTAQVHKCIQVQLTILQFTQQIDKLFTITQYISVIPIYSLELSSSPS